MDIFETLVELQRCHLYCAMFVLVGHILLIILKRCERNKVVTDQLGKYVIKGYNKSKYGEILKGFETGVLVVFPIVFHFVHVTIMFLGSYISSLEKERNWEIGVKIYTKSLVNVLFCLFLCHYSLKKYGSFDFIFLVPANLEVCKYVSLQKNIDAYNGNYTDNNRAENHCKAKRIIKPFSKIISFFLDDSFNTPILRVVNNKEKQINFFGSKVSRYFEHNNEKYWWINDKFTWSRDHMVEILSNRRKQNSNSRNKFDSPIAGAFDEKETVLEFVGLNTVKIPQAKTMELLYSELTSAINIFRVIILLDSLFYSFIVWPLFWSTLTFYSILWSVFKRRKNSIETEKMLDIHNMDVYKLLNCDIGSTPLDLNDSSFGYSQALKSFTFSKQLYPGTIIIIDKSMRVPADLILLYGSIVVDESCLTGEAVPQKKVSDTCFFDLKEFIEVNFNFFDQRKLFAGSQIIEVSSSTPALAMVTKTGSVASNQIFNSNYINSHPFSYLDVQMKDKTPQLENTHHKSSKSINWNIKIKPLWFICFFFGLFITLFDAYTLSFEIGSIFFILSSVVYILPFWATASMSFSYNSCIKRFLKNKIVSTNPYKFGQFKIIDTVCLDKTGTLTVPEFNVYKTHIFHPTLSAVGPCNLYASSSCSNTYNCRTDHYNSQRSIFMTAIAVCNNLVFQNVENTPDSAGPSGSKLELSLFKSSGYFGCKVTTFNSERIVVVPSHNKDKFLTEINHFQNSKCTQENRYTSNNLKEAFPRDSIEYILATCCAVEVVKRYPFNEDLRLQSVCVRSYYIDSKLQGSDNVIVKSVYTVFTKGAVESITELTQTFDSNRDEDYYMKSSKLKESCFGENIQETEKSKDNKSFANWSSAVLNNQVPGSYVLGFCYSICSVDKNTIFSSLSSLGKEGKTSIWDDQKKLIRSLPFTPLGIVELFSPIREEAKDVVQSLIMGNFHCPIITGDYINSAILVSKELGIINDDLVVCDLDCKKNLVWDFTSQGRKETIENDIILSLNSDNHCYSLLDLVPKSVLYDNTSIAINLRAFKVLLQLLSESNNSYSDISEEKRIENQRMFSNILGKILVFSRFTPEYKGKVVSLLEHIGKTVLFVGDGPNDTIALQKASIGLFLSNANSDNGHVRGREETSASVGTVDCASSINGNIQVANMVVAPFIARMCNGSGLYSIKSLIIESRGIVFTTVSKYMYVINFGIFFVSCKSILLWQSHAIIPAMSWLFIDILCTFAPLLIFSFSVPNENTSFHTSEHKPVSRASFRSNHPCLKNRHYSLLNINVDSAYNKPLTEEEEVQGDYNTPINAEGANKRNSLSSTSNNFVSTLSRFHGNHVIYTSSLVSLFISIFGYTVMLYRLVHHILPKYGMESCYKYNKPLPTYLWYVKQDNFEAASSWCYITFQLVNQVWLIWIRSQSIIKMKANSYLILWNLMMNLFILFLIWTKPCVIGCIFRINCDNETSLNKHVSLFDSSPFYGQYKHNIFPFEWKIELTMWCFFFFFLNLISLVAIKKVVHSKKAL